MAISDVKAYANVSADALAASVGRPSEEQKDDAVSNQKLKAVLAKVQEKVQGDKKVKEGEVQKGQTQKSENKAESLFKGLLDGKAGPEGKAAAQLFQAAGLSKTANNQSKELLGEVTQKTPQAGFAAASSFSRTSAQPGADKALGSDSALASQALVVTTEAAQKGDKELKQVESAISEFVSAFGNDDTQPNVKKKVLDNTAKNPGSESHKAAMEWGKSKQIKLQNGPAQESMANLLKKADPKDPAKFKETMKGLEKFVGDPKLLSPKLNGADMKSNFSNLTKAVTGGEKLSVSLEAQEKILSSSKFHAMPSDARAKIQSAVGKAPQQADKVAQSMGQVRDSRLPKLASKLAQKGLSDDALKQSVAECKTREVAYPPIEPYDPDNPRPPGHMIAFTAKWKRVAQQIDNQNKQAFKAINKAQSLKQLNEVPVPRGFGPIVGTASSAEELAQNLGCSLEEARVIMDLHSKCEDSKSKDMPFSKTIAQKRRMLRGKPEPRTHLKEKRTLGAALPKSTTITLTDDQHSSTTQSLKKLLASGGSATKTTAVTGGAQPSVAAAPAPSKEEIAARNTQTVRPTGSSMTVGGAKVKGWGNNTVAVGMDREQQLKRLAKLREEKVEAHKKDSTQLSKGPMIGRASDFVPLAEIVSNKTPWIQLSPAVKAALRNLQVTPNILESWQTNKPIYSSLQAQPWESLKEIQQKSALLVQLTPDNWNALASVLSTAMKTPGELRKAKSTYNPNNVQMKGGA